MPVITREIPDYGKLPQQLFGGAFTLWLAPGGAHEDNRGAGYYFHDQKSWADRSARKLGRL